MLHRGIAAGLAVVGLCLGPAVLASTALAQEQPSAQVFQTWRTTTLGTYKSVDAYPVRWIQRELELAMLLTKSSAGLCFLIQGRKQS
jgi:hypothetical protein